MTQLKKQVVDPVAAQVDLKAPWDGLGGCPLWSAQGMETNHNLLVQQRLLEFRQMLEHLLGTDGLLFVDDRLLLMLIPSMEGEAPVCQNQAHLHRGLVQWFRVLALHNLPCIDVQRFDQGQDQVLSQWLMKLLWLGFHPLSPLCGLLDQKMQRSCRIWIQKKNELICSAKTVHFLIVAYQEMCHGVDQLKGLAGCFGLTDLVCFWGTWPSSSGGLRPARVWGQVQCLVQQRRQLAKGAHHLLRDALVGVPQKGVHVGVCCHSVWSPARGPLG